MIRLVILGGLVAAVMLSGCGAQSVLLGSEGEYLFTVMDVLSLPGEPAQLRAKLQGGDLLRGRAGYVVRFYRDGKLFKAAQTGPDGVATAYFVPPAPGDYRFTADLSPIGFAGAPPASQSLLVACRSADEPIVVTDLDWTVVASGFHKVLIGQAAPMARSAEVLERLSKDHSIVYLTHRPDYFGVKSRQWLKTNGYPSGPLLLASVGGFLKGSGAFKTEMLAAMGRKFKRIDIAMGDKVSDAQAYFDNGIRSFLIVQIPDGNDSTPYTQLADDIATLDDKVQVVTGWDQIEKAIFAGASYPRSQTEAQLRKLAAELIAAQTQEGDK